MNKHRWLSLCVLAAAGMLHGQAPSREQVRTVLSRQDDTVKVIALSDRITVLRHGDDETVFVEFRGKSETVFDRFAIIAGSEGDFS